MPDAHPFAVHFRDDKPDERPARSGAEGAAKVDDKPDERPARSGAEGAAKVDDKPHALERAGVYEQALALTTAIDRIVDKTDARFHLKDLIDKSSTIVALRIAQAAGETSKGERRRQYRIARRAATDCAAILDILARRPGCDAALIAPARTIVLGLVARLAQLATI